MSGSNSARKPSARGASVPIATLRRARRSSAETRIPSGKFARLMKLLRSGYYQHLAGKTHAALGVVFVENSNHFVLQRSRLLSRQLGDFFTEFLRPFHSHSPKVFD